MIILSHSAGGNAHVFRAAKGRGETPRHYGAADKTFRLKDAVFQTFPPQSLSLGSSASRSPSPRRLKLSTVRKIARPGKMVTKGTVAM